MISLSTGQIRVIKSVGYPAFFFCCFFLFFSLTFPAERFLPVAEFQLSKVLGRKVNIDELTISPMGSVTLKGVSIEVPGDETAVKEIDEEADTASDTATATAIGTDSKATDKDRLAQKPIVPKYYIEEMNIKVSVWSLLFGDLNVVVAADFLGGNILVKYTAPLNDSKEEEKKNNDDLANLPPAERVKLARERREQAAVLKNVEKVEERQERSISIVATGLNLIQFWDLKDLLPLPMFGTLDFGIDLKTATGKMVDAEGKMWVDGRNLSFGKGQSQVEIIDGMGPMTVDAIAIKSLQLEMNAIKGKCTVGQVKLLSNDLAATAQGDIQFADPFSLSRMNLYFTFKLLEGYANKSPNAQTLVSLMPGAFSRAMRADDSFGFIYSGFLKTAKFRSQKTFGPADRPSRTATRRSTRPTTRSRSIGRPPSPPVTSPRPMPPVSPPAEEPMEPDMEDKEIPEPPPSLAPPSGRVNANLQEMSEQMQARQNESERRRMEATLRAKAVMDVEVEPEGVNEESVDVVEPEVETEDDSADGEGENGEEGVGEDEEPERDVERDEEPGPEDEEEE